MPPDPTEQNHDRDHAALTAPLEAQWRGAVVALLWRSGAVLPWRRGAVAQWRSGAGRLRKVSRPERLVAPQPRPQTADHTPGR